MTKLFNPLWEPTLLLVLVLFLSSTGESRAQVVPAQAVLFNRYDFTKVPAVLQLAVINPNGTGEHQVVVNLPELGFPTWSKDGQILAVSSQCPSTPLAFSRNVFLVDLRNGQTKQITQFSDKAAIGGGAMISSICFPWNKAFSSDKTRVAVSALEFSNVTVVGDQDHPDDPNKIISSFQATPVLQVYGSDGTPGALVTMCGLGMDSIHAGDGVDWAPDQDLLVYPVDRQITIINNVGQALSGLITPLFLIPPTNDAMGRAKQLTSPRATADQTWTGPVSTWQTDFQPAFSPNGKQIAYVRGDHTLKTGLSISFAQAHSIRLVNLDGSNDHEIASFNAGQCISHLTWSPDGTALDFDIGNQAYSNAGAPMTIADTKTCSIWWINIDGTGLKSLHVVPSAWPAWYPGLGIGQVDHPQITIALVPQAGGPKIVLTWPAGAATLVLKSTPKLAPKTDWNVEQVQPIVAGGQATVTLTIPPSTRFYGLFQE